MRPGFDRSVTVCGKIASEPSARGPTEAGTQNASGRVVGLSAAPTSSASCTPPVCAPVLAVAERSPAPAGT